MPQIHHKSGSFVTGDDWKLQERCGAVMEIYFFCKGIGLSFCGELFYLSPAQSSQTSYCHCMKCFKAGRSPALPAGWLPLAEESVSDNLESLSSSTSSGWPLSKHLSIHMVLTSIRMFLYWALFYCGRTCSLLIQLHNFWAFMCPEVKQVIKYFQGYFLLCFV